MLSGNGPDLNESRHESSIFLFMQPVSGYKFTNVVAAGTTVLKDMNAVLHSVVLPGTYVGSIEFYDSATAAGTAASNLIYTMGLPLTNAYKDIQFDAQCRNGLTYVATGTPTVTVLWS